ncbi:MAG: hypothetical protein HC836_26645 [Richelia sp. RM2_1_2]|nr:hypothetical protein [Richelia sp. SM1_7_0]NJN07953.1 hypothetical protein [Richelia sp. RM1_1_1]NJO30518.1 hypothetical protein [Richelia sp. SL_2_1]NJO61695.1 hypothetical protein [Richelia sp. RM2_1_2]
MKFISGILGGNKKNGNFFLELKEEPDEPMPYNDSKTVEASNNGANGAKPAPTNGAKSVDTVKVKDENNQVKEVPSDKVKQVDVELIQTAKGLEATAVPVENKKAAKKASTTVNKPEEPKETTFAPKYLIPKNDNVRRRPGANMNSFLDMARQVKTPMN